MKLVVGLGNPGPKYETNRHNVGFLAIDRMIDDWKATGPTTKNQGEVYQAKVGGEPVLIVKPQTFMNLSGRCVGPLFTFYKCAPEDLIVVYDELDLPPLTIKLKTGGSAGGHNGLKSIDQAIGSDQMGYHRVRIGIGQPLLPNGSRIPAETWVLQNFTDDELKGLDPLLDEVKEAVELLIRGDATKAMNRFNQKKS